MATPIVMDTNSIHDRDFLYWLRGYHGRKILPAIAYTELGVYFVGIKRRTFGHVDHILNSAGIEIEWYRKSDAQSAARMGVECGNFKAKARDYMIASHACMAPTVLVTNNKKDFEYLDKRVMTPLEAMKNL